MTTTTPSHYHMVKGKVARQAHVGLPDGTFEEEHGRDGFYGPVSHVYRTHRPTDWTRIAGPLKPRAIDTNKLHERVKSVDPVLGRQAVLYNDDVVVLINRFNATGQDLNHIMPYYFRNGDGDEVYFIHQGEGLFETDFGPLSYRRGDYIVIPKGTTYRIVPTTGEQFLVIFESRSRITQPDRGLMGLHALYDPALLETPEPQPSTYQPLNNSEWEIKIKRGGDITSVFYPFNPLDVIGWKGDLSVWKLNIQDICPVMSHRAHLPPSVHSTLMGEHFIICSFVPRPFEFPPEAERVPFYHRNIDYDEVIFYHDGDFFSRDGIDPGMITFHPAGIHHGPHPKARNAVKSLQQTDEYAVMLDTYHPLKLTPEAHSVEWKEYYLSWQENPQAANSV